MREYWIGNENNSSGTYISMGCKGLQLRKGGMINAVKLYRFTDILGREFNITESEVVQNIERLIENENKDSLSEYLYKLVLERFGTLSFIKGINQKLIREKEKGYEEGKRSKQQEIQKVLGLGSW